MLTSTPVGNGTMRCVADASCARHPVAATAQAAPASKLPELGVARGVTMVAVAIAVAVPLAVPLAVAQAPFLRIVAFGESGLWGHVTKASLLDRCCAAAGYSSRRA